MFGPFDEAFEEPFSEAFDMLPPYQPDPDEPFHFPDAQPRQFVPPSPMEPEYSETETESEVPTFYGVAADCPDILCTDVAHVREVIASRTGYPGYGQLGRWLKDKQGLIVLPLDAISLIRTPFGGHVANPKVVVFHPTQSFEHYSQFPQFQECVRKFYSE